MTKTKQISINVVCVRKPTYREKSEYDLRYHSGWELKINKVYKARAASAYRINGDYFINDYYYPKELFITEFDRDLKEILNAT